MMKKIMINIIFVVGLIMICLFVANKNKFDITKSPSLYLANDIKSRTEYTNFIKKYITPKKLANFLNVVYIRFSNVESCDTGTESIKWFKHEAYSELFYQMFDKNREGYDDCPVTENFKNKFGNNLFEYFKFNDTMDSFVSCVLVDKDKELIVDEAGDFNVGEPGYIYYHHFHYTLDEEGNVDDIIFDYTEE